MSRAHRRRDAAGQSLVEYLIILPSLLLLLLGAVQFGLLYQAKSQLNYAVFVAARQGALKNGNMTAVKDAFAAGMAPLFANSPDVPGMLRGRAVGAIEAFNPLVTKFKRVNPPEGNSVMTDFGVADPLDGSKKFVPNDNLLYRSSTPGKNSNISIQDANLLKIRVTYCAKLVVPIANVVFYSLVSGVEGLSTIGGHLFQPDKKNDALPTDSTCTQIRHRYGDKIIAGANTIDGVLGTDLESDATSLMNTINTILETSIPVINWSIGGYRIPITAEAVVRMQSPLR